MDKLSKALNRNNQDLSNADFMFGLDKNFYLACNFFLALRVLHGKVSQEDFVLLSYKKDLFLEVLRTKYAPCHIRKISEKLEKWEEELTDLLQKIENNQEDYADYYDQVEETEETGFDTAFKYHKVTNWYHNHNYYELENTREVLAELNPEIIDYLEGIGARQAPTFASKILA